MARKKIGSQTPTLSKLKRYTKSDYKKAIDLYEKSGNKAQKWQETILKHILAYNKNHLWVHTKFGYSLPRRNGKSEILLMRELYGIIKGEQINHTAHRTTTSHASWEKLCRVLDKIGITYESLRATGRERVEIPETGGRVEFRTRTTTGGLGEGFDLLIIDEAQEYTADQESALKYVVTDSQNPQTLMCGTPPTVVSAGTVFVDFKNDVIEGASKNGAWCEWGVEEQSDPHDKKLWYKTNPSLGTIFTERSVEDEIGNDIVDFNIQRLGLWIKYNQKSAISEVDWLACKVDKLPELKGSLFCGIKFGQDGRNAALSIAVKTVEDDVFIESIDCQSVKNGDDWLIDFMKHAKPELIVIDGASRQSILQEELRAAKIKNICLPTVKEIINANSLWEQAIYEKTISHMDQASLTQVATNCEKRNIGSQGGFGYRAQFEEMDISLMDSALLAHWACKNYVKPKKQKIIY